MPGIPADKKHNMRNHPAYSSWGNMKNRCNNPNWERYADWGGRGISYDPSWEFFIDFWADMGDTWKPGLTLDRIDNDGNYNKENCRWTTPVKQSRNRRDNRWVEYKGQKYVLKELCEIKGLLHKYRQIITRIENWGDIERAIDQPFQDHQKTITYRGKTQSRTAWAKEIGINKARFYHCYNRKGMSMERIFEEEGK